MVSNSALAAVCVWSGLSEHLVFESNRMGGHFLEYTVKLKAKQDEEYSAAKREGRSPGQYWVDIEPPKV